jgi:transcriptional regulator with XRE-family HTH domain
MNNIRFIRTKVFKVSQAEFARIAGTGQAVVSRWEQGETSPSLHQLRLIRDEAKSRTLSWDHDWLFGTLPTDQQSEATG